MLPINPQYQSLIQLLSARLFRIPDYQRAYSWTDNERQELFSDIETTFAKSADAGHFMATVVCLRRKIKPIGTDEFQELEVVDGQQRLTTLIILLQAIRLALGTNDEASKRAADEIEDLLLKQGTSESASALLVAEHFGSVAMRDDALKEFIEALVSSCFFVAEEHGRPVLMFVVGLARFVGYYETICAQGITFWLPKLEGFIRALKFHVDGQHPTRIVSEEEDGVRL